MTSQHPSLHHNHIILHVKPPKKVPKVLQSKQEHNSKETVKRGSRSYHKFSLTGLFSDPNYNEPHKYLSHLKQLKSIRYLNFDLVSLYSSDIPAKYTQKIFDSLKYFKNLSVIHFELKFPELSFQDSSINPFCQGLLILNRLTQVQITFSFHVSTLVPRPEKLKLLFEAFLGQLKRLTSINLAFSEYFNVESILQLISPLKKNKSLKEFSFTLEKGFSCTSTQFQEFLGVLKDIKSLKSSEIVFKSSRFPCYEQLKTIIPLLKKFGQKEALTMTFENSLDEFTNSEKLLFIKSIKKIKSPHKIQVKITDISLNSSWRFCLRIVLILGCLCCAIAAMVVTLRK